MRVFVAGGTGVIGRRVVSQLVARGHQVTATTTSPAKLDQLSQLGAEAVVLDGLDATAVGEAVAKARPDVIVHQMTAISPTHAGKPNFKHLDRWFALTIRLRTEGTDHLLAAAEAAGVGHLIAQSYAPTKAFLSAVVTRISIDVLRSARVRREQYVGPWFPEPLLTDPYQDPERSAELADSVSMAALLLLERLSPLERAVFVLREVFGFGFAEVATAVGRSEAACRQLAARARRHMDAGRPRFETDRRERDRLATRFFQALREGDVDSLRELLAADVQLIGDGGGKAPQWARGIAGADNVARVLTSMLAPMIRIEVSWQPREVNGQPGAIFRDRDGRVLNTWTLDILDGSIQAIRTVLNPDKLSHVGPVADAWAVLREATRARRAGE